MEQHLQELINKIPTGLLIGDTWREGSAGETFDVLNPATEEKLTTLASATPEDAIAALDAACQVQDQWAHTPQKFLDGHSTSSPIAPKNSPPS